jgi:hypothetical protein
LHHGPRPFHIDSILQGSIVDGLNDKCGVNNRIDGVLPEQRVKWLAHTSGNEKKVASMKLFWLPQIDSDHACDLRVRKQGTHKSAANFAGTASDQDAFHLNRLLLAGCQRVWPCRRIPGNSAEQGPAVLVEVDFDAVPRRVNVLEPAGRNLV